MKLSKTKTIRISETQHQTLVKMKSYNIDVGRFIREAIKEKINREYEYLIPKKLKSDCLSVQMANQINKILNK